MALRPVLSLDLSLATGWCVGCAGDDLPLFGTWRLGCMADGAGAIGATLLDNLADAMAAYGPRAISYETPLPNVRHTKTRGDVARLLPALGVLVETFAFRRGVEVYEENSQRLRRAVMGNGRQTKPQIMAWARARGWQVGDDNQADALALWVYTVKILEAVP